MRTAAMDDYFFNEIKSHPGAFSVVLYQKKSKGRDSIRTHPLDSSPFWETA